MIKAIVKCRDCGRSATAYFSIAFPETFELDEEWVFGCKYCLGSEVQIKCEEWQDIERTWREVDRVYETRWDCLRGRREAAVFGLGGATA